MSVSKTPACGLLFSSGSGEGSSGSLVSSLRRHGSGMGDSATLKASDVLPALLYICISRSDACVFR